MTKATVMIFILAASVRHVSPCPSSCSCQNGVATCNGLGDDSFSLPDDITHLVLNNLKGIDVESFRPGNAQNLKKLSIFDSEFDVLPVCLIESSELLETIEIGRCEIGRIQRELLTNLTNLRTITFHSVSIGTIGRFSFYNLHGLESIILSQVTITKIEKDAFASMDLTSLHITEASIQLIESFAFNNLNISKTFVLSDGSISVISDSAFHKIHAGVNITLEHLDIGSLGAARVWGVFDEVGDKVVFHSNKVHNAFCSLVGDSSSGSWILVNNTFPCVCSTEWLYEEYRSHSLEFGDNYCHRNDRLDYKFSNITKDEWCPSSLESAGYSCTRKTYSPSEPGQVIYAACDNTHSKNKPNTGSPLRGHALYLSLCTISSVLRITT